MLVSATAVQAEMAELRDAGPWQLKCMRLCTVAVDLFAAAAAVTHTPREDDGKAARELVAQQVLGIRVLNSMGAADELILQGFYQPAGIMIRDIVECAYLLDLFSRAPEHLPKWITLGQEAAPEGAVHIGPFVDEIRPIGLTYDLTRFGVLAAMHLCRWMIVVDLVENQAYQTLGEACVAIERAFLGLNAHLKKVPRNRLRE